VAEHHGVSMLGCSISSLLRGTKTTLQRKYLRRGFQDSKRQLLKHGVQNGPVSIFRDQPTFPALPVPQDSCMPRSRTTTENRIIPPAAPSTHTQAESVASGFLWYGSSPSCPLFDGLLSSPVLRFLFLVPRVPVHMPGQGQSPSTVPKACGCAHSQGDAQTAGRQSWPKGRAGTLKTSVMADESQDAR
jgi:hypothetical protein